MFCKPVNLISQESTVSSININFKKNIFLGGYKPFFKWNIACMLNIFILFVVEDEGIFLNIYDVGFLSRLFYVGLILLLYFYNDVAIFEEIKYIVYQKIV